MNNISFNELPKQLANLLHRYHIVIFAFIVLGGIAVVILILSNTLQVSTQPGTSAGIDTAFDKTTIDRVNQLKTRDDAVEDIMLPAGRINPFVE